MALADLFNDIADAIREKDGTSAEIVASTFPARIRAIPTGIGGVQLESIAITAPPLKTAYYSGDVFDPTGMAVYATYSNGQTMYVNHSNLTFDPSGPLEAGTTSITVKFQWGLKMASTFQEISVVSAMCFGVVWDYSNPSTALTRLTPETDPKGYVTVTVSSEPSPATGDGIGSSPFDAYMPWAGMEEYNIASGGISHKKGEPGFSRANDTVVYIPEFWYDCIDNEAESKRYWYVSDMPLEGMERHPGSKKYIARYKVDSSIISKTGVSFYGGQTVGAAISKCAAKGNGFCLSDARIWSAIQLLYLVEFANWDSQAMIGNGVYGDSTNVYVANGKTDIMSYHTGKSEDIEWPQVQYRGIEGVFGNALEMIDGLKISNKVISASLDNVNYEEIGSYSGYSTDSVKMSITKLLFNEKYKFLFAPKAGEQNAAGEYIPDSVYAGEPGSAYLCLGGYYAMKLNGGLFFCYASIGGTSNYGFRYIYDPEKE